MDVDISSSSSSSSSSLLARDPTMISYLVPLDGAVTPTSAAVSSFSSKSSSSAFSSSSLLSSLPQTGEGWLVQVYKGRRDPQGKDPSRVGVSSTRQQQSQEKSVIVEEGVYEGGSAIWECTWDLLQYILRSSISSQMLPAGHVLDLGCGHGLVGLLLLQLGAHAAVFQDLNEEVLRDITKPTILANLEWREKATGEVNAGVASQHAVEGRCARKAEASLCDGSLKQLHAIHCISSSPDKEEGSLSSSVLPSLSDKETLFTQPLSIRDKTCYFLSTDWRNFPSLCCLCSCRCHGGKEGEEGAQQRSSCLEEEERESSHHCHWARVESDKSSSASATSSGGTLKHAGANTGLQFDWIVASECIYRPSNFQTLLDLLRARLKRRTGKALIAAKRYYFGIGGGSLPFLKFVRDAEEMRRHARDEKKKRKKDLMEVTVRDSGRDEFKFKESNGNKGASLDRREEVDGQTEREEEMIAEEKEDHLHEGDLSEEEDDLEIEIVHTIQDNVSNVRDILLLRKKDHLSLCS